jgi:hypothetical protein
MDCRHGEGALEKAICEEVGAYKCYGLSHAGGAGALAGKIFPERISAVLYDINAAITLGAEKVFLTIHGASDHDPKGCGGYILSGEGAAYETPEKSRAFSVEQLQSALACLEDAGIPVPVQAFYVIFGPNGENYLEEVHAKEPAEALA